jgi:hypothetical protein
MAAKTVFISSTYTDLKDHRRAVWAKLESFDVIVRGMEQFGARTMRPLETCLAEVEQSDVYVGIIAYRLGSIDSERQQPFTLLEYEKADKENKEILIYLADDDTGFFPKRHMDDDPESRDRLDAFKQQLREKHTVNSFSSPDDLAEKLSHDFQSRFLTKTVEISDQRTDAEAFAKTNDALRIFHLMPLRRSGYEGRFLVEFQGRAFPASRTLCRNFNLPFGFTVGAYIRIVQPIVQPAESHSWEIYAVGSRAIELNELINKCGSADLYARLQFSEDDVPAAQAEFFSRRNTGVVVSTSVVPYSLAEGKMILLFTKLHSKAASVSGPS